MGSKGSQTTTTSNSPNPQAMQAYQNLLTQAGNVAATPYTPYNNELVAPFNQQQNTGVAGINNYANYAQPYIQQAAGLATNAAAPITAADISQYESPYTQQVVQATQNQFNNQNAQQQQGVISNAAAQGALGGNRVGITQANLANQQQLAQAPVIAGLENQGYQTGLNTALTEQQAQAAGAYSLGNLGVSGQNAGITGAGAQLGAGTAQQQTQQAQDVAAYQQFLNQMAYPYQQTSWLAGVDTGVGSQMGGTGTTTGSAPSSLNSWLGLGAAGVGAVGQAGGWAALASMLSSGGSVGRARGGVAPEEGSTIPETHETLLAQQHQLLDGHRRVQMFPRGTRELFLPHGINRVVADGDVFHYDPHRISAEQIKHAAAQGRENELLDLGPVSKHEVMDRVSRGEHPVAVVERRPDGTEVRAAAGTHVTAPHQLAAMHRTKSPGHNLHIEDPRFTLAMRHHRANGGRLSGFDTGGGVAGIGMSATPYSGGKGWIPGMGITHGQGAPRPPGVANQPTPSAAQMGQQVGALAKSLNGDPNTTGPFGVGNSNPGGAGASGYGLLPSDVSAFPSNWGTGGSGLSDVMGGAGDMMVPTAARRGGSVGRYASGGIANLPMQDRIMMPRGYAEGGMPDIPFDPTLGGIAPAFDPFGDNAPTQFNVDPSVGNLARNVYLNSGPPLSDSTGFAPVDAGVVNPTEGGITRVPKTSEGTLAPSFADRAGDEFNPDTFAPTSSVAPTLADQGVSNAAIPFGPLTSPGFGEQPSAPVTGKEAIPPARAADIGTPTLGYADNMDRIAAAHRQIESADRQNPGGNYSALGPINPKTGDRAYGAYQVMGDNVPTWTKEILGRSMTPQEFLHDKEAQDTVYKAKMGSYIDQLGLPGAVHAWLGPGSKDFADTTQDEYLRRFNTALGSPSDGTRTAGVASDEAQLPPHAEPVQHPGGVANIDWSANGKLWPALMSAGFGMMASRSPFPGVAIGEGGQQGLQTYATQRQQEAQAGMKQQEIDLEAKKLMQSGDIAQKKLALETRPYEGQMTAYQKAETDATAKYRQGLLDRENSQYLGPTQDGTGSVFLDKRTGQTEIRPIQIGPRPVGGATASLASQLMADREKQRAADPSLPPLTLEEATTLAHRAPNADQDTIRRLNLASGAWKAWTSNPVNMGKKNAPESSLDFWEKRYGVNPAAPAAGTARPVLAPPTAPAPPAPPAGATAAVKPPLVKQNGHVYKLQPDGSYIAVQ